MVSLTASSQELVVRGFEQATTDITAKKYPKYDNNQIMGALIKVQTGIHDLVFKGLVLGTPEKKTGEYYVYMAAGSKFVQIAHDSYGTIRVSFDSFGISRLESKVTYILRLADSRYDSFKFEFKCNVSNANLYVDGKYLGDVSSRYDISNGTHEVRLTSDGYYDLNTTIIVSNEIRSSKIDMVKKPVVASKKITVKGVDFDMIKVEGGCFTMGATSEQSHPQINEKPTRDLTIKSFYIGETEVTQALWKAVMGTNPSLFINKMDYPVENISYDDCLLFISKLNDITHARFRLPTEAEWEYAARGGCHSQQRIYSGYNTMQDAGWFINNAGATPHPVKTKMANELGIYDMSGNVAEWCSDKYTMYDDLTRATKYNIARGGAWNSYATQCRTASRDYYAPNNKFDYLGLRLVLEM